MSNQLAPEVANFYRTVTPRDLDAAIKEANEVVNRSLRNHRYMGEGRIAQWRATGMLDETAPGSWEETTLAHMLENQRTMKEC